MPLESSAARASLPASRVPGALAAASLALLLGCLSPPSITLPSGHERSTGEKDGPPPSASSADAFVIVGATIFDGERFRGGNVRIVGGLIEGFVDDPGGGRVVDGRGHTLLPGLIDGHAHIGETTSYLERFATFGVTTVIDLFGPPGLIGALRRSDLEVEGRARASLFGAGNLATAPRGHGTEYGIPIPTLERPEEAGAFVAARRAEGSDFLKIVYDTSPADVAGKAAAMPTLSIETVRALVKAGHDQGLPVIVHTGGCDDIRAVLATGPDVIAHGCAMKPGDTLPRELGARGVFFNPTLAVQLRPCGLEYWIPLVAEPDLAARLTEEERGRLGRDRKDHDPACSEGRLRLAGEAARAGVRLVAGPDSPNRRIPVGASLLAELELLSLAGATIEQVLASATSNPADAYRLRDRGRIARGLRADLVLVLGDVRTSPRAILRTRRVWKAGVPVPLDLRK